MLSCKVVTCLPPPKHPNIHARTHTHPHTHMYTHMHARMHTITYTHTLTCKWARMHVTVKMATAFKQNLNMGDSRHAIWLNSSSVTYGHTLHIHLLSDYSLGSSRCPFVWMSRPSVISFQYGLHCKNAANDSLHSVKHLKRVEMSAIDLLKVN